MSPTAGLDLHEHAQLTASSLVGLAVLCVATAVLVGLLLRPATGAVRAGAAPTTETSPPGRPREAWLPGPATPWPGSLALAAVPRPPVTATGGPGLVAALTAFAGVLHLFVAREHLVDHLSHGVFFALLGLTQVAAAWAVRARATETAMRVGVAVLVWPVVLWAASRTTGIALVAPREPVGGLDLVTTATELLAVGLAVLVLRAWGGGR